MRIDETLDNFYIPVKAILEDKQYLLPEGYTAKNYPYYKENEDNFLRLFNPPHPRTKYNPQAILHHVQSVELKKFGLYTYRTNKLTSDSFLRVTTLEAYNKHLNDSQDNMELLLKYTKTDFDELLRLINKDIEDYQEELNQLAKNSSN